MTDWDNDGANDDESGEEIIELTDIVMDEPDSGAEDSIIELTDIVKNEGTDLNLDIVRMETGAGTKDLNLDIVRMETGAGTKDFDLGLELEEKADTFQRDQRFDPESPFALTLEQVEAALEKVIEKQFADKIQTILFQVVEKVIEKEITEIRESLQKDLDQIENA